MTAEAALHKVKIQQFEGPLDLLLQLIDDNKLKITDVALAQVTEQYLRILHQAERQVTAGELADFLAVAARLLLIKSRALLPFLEWEADEEEGLAKQLRIYKRFLEASREIQKLISRKRFAYSRERLLVSGEIGFQPPAGLTAVRLATVFRGILAGLEPPQMLQQEVLRRTVSLQEKIQHLRERIWSQTGSSSFQKLLADAKDRTEVIVSFIALLELVKQRHVVVQQDENFADIVIDRFRRT